MPSWESLAPHASIAFFADGCVLGRSRAGGRTLAEAAREDLLKIAGIDHAQCRAEPQESAVVAPFLD